MAPIRVLQFSTTVGQMNGYSSIAFELARRLCQHDDIQLTYWGFQNFHNNQNHNAARKLPDHVQVYDAFANEVDKSNGFGFSEVAEFVKMNKPDVCLIYNDMVVVSNIISQLQEYKKINTSFKIIVYIDQVYLCQKREAVKLLNENADLVVAFTPFWEECIKKQGLTTKTDVLLHGFNPEIYYPFPKELARMYFGLNNDDFIILNLNRNQPRKRWDITIMAFAAVVSRHIEDPIKLLVGTSLGGSWNLLEVYERELSKYGLSLEEGMKHVIMIDNPQQLTDEEINIMYNACDVGLNTADGEGFGMTNLQHGGIGKTQIVPKLGGFLEFLDATSAIMIEPKINIYIDNSRDGVGGESQVCDWNDFSDAIENCYTNPDVIEKLGRQARKNIVAKLKWDDIGEKYYQIITNLSKSVKNVEKNDNLIPLSELGDDQDIMEITEKVEESIIKTDSSPARLKQTSLLNNDASTEKNSIKSPVTSGNLDKSTKTPVTSGNVEEITPPLEAPKEILLGGNLPPPSQLTDAEAEKKRKKREKKERRKKAEAQLREREKKSSSSKSTERSELLALKAQIEKLLVKN